MTLYNKLWKAIHFVGITIMVYFALASFVIPSIEFWHPLDLELRHLELEHRKHEERMKEIQREYELMDEPEWLELQQAEREMEIEPRQNE